MAHPKEVRVTDPTTGASKGQKLARFDLIPARVMWELAEHYGKGCAKYSERNWERGYSWSLSFAALMRHAWAFWRGEDIDPETGTPHIVSAAWHCFALAEFRHTHQEKDDRTKQKEPEAVEAPTKTKAPDKLHLPLQILVQNDGQWVANVDGIAGTLTYGNTRADAIKNTKILALSIIIEKMQNNEISVEERIVFDFVELKPTP